MTSEIILLDSGPLGFIAHPKIKPEIRDWVRKLREDGKIILIPEIADYEVRRNMILEKMNPSIQRLNALKSALGYVPLTTEVMMKAAEIWADARKNGQPTASKDSLDGDVILAAQAASLEAQGLTVIIATTNIGHLNRFTKASKWEDIE